MIVAALVHWLIVVFFVISDRDHAPKACPENVNCSLNKTVNEPAYKKEIPLCAYVCSLLFPTFQCSLVPKYNLSISPPLAACQWVSKQMGGLDLQH